MGACQCSWGALIDVFSKHGVRLVPRGLSFRDFRSILSLAKPFGRLEKELTRLPPRELRRLGYRAALSFPKLERLDFVQNYASSFMGHPVHTGLREGTQASTIAIHASMMSVLIGARPALPVLKNLTLRDEVGAVDCSNLDRAGVLETVSIHASGAFGIGNQRPPMVSNLMIKACHIEIDPSFAAGLKSLSVTCCSSRIVLWTGKDRLSFDRVDLKELRYIWDPSCINGSTGSNIANPYARVDRWFFPKLSTCVYSVFSFFDVDALLWTTDFLENLCVRGKGDICKCIVDKLTRRKKPIDFLEVRVPRAYAPVNFVPTVTDFCMAKHVLFWLEVGFFGQIGLQLKPTDYMFVTRPGEPPNDVLLRTEALTSLAVIDILSGLEPPDWMFGDSTVTAHVAFDLGTLRDDCGDWFPLACRRIVTGSCLGIAERGCEALAKWKKKALGARGLARFCFSIVFESKEVERFTWSKENPDAFVRAGDVSKERRKADREPFLRRRFGWENPAFDPDVDPDEHPLTAFDDDFRWSASPDYEGE